MGAQSYIVLQIFLGVVAAVVAVGFITNSLEWLFSNVRKLAEDFPKQPVNDASTVTTGENSFAVSREPYTVGEARGFLRGMGCVAWIVGAVWFAASIGIGIAFATGATPPGTLWAVLMTSALLGWTIFFFMLAYRVLTSKAWHRLVKWTADDEHLHITPVTSVGAPNATVSVPWAALDAIEVDPASPAWVRAPVGKRWIHGAAEMFDREISLRREMGLADTPADVARRGIDDDTVLDDLDAPTSTPTPGANAPPDRPAQSWDDLGGMPPRDGTSRP
jgi:hypothetical protein